MKKTILFVIIVLLIVGCNTQPEHKETTEDIEKILDSAINSSDVELCNKIGLDTMRDACISEVAILLGDEESCEKAGKSRDHCLTGIAEKNNQPELCEDIKEEYWWDICFRKAALSSENESLCERVFDDDTYDDCFKEVAEKTNDEKVCLNIQIYPKKVLCIANIAQEKRDYKICNLISDDIKRYANCYLKVAKLTQNQSICEEIGSKQIRERCFLTVEKG